MDAATAAAAARPAIDRLGNERFAADLPELADVLASHHYFAVYVLGRCAPLGGGPDTLYAAMPLFPASLVRKVFDWVDGPAREDVRRRCIAAYPEAGQRRYGDVADGEELADRLETLVDATDLADRVIAAAWRDLPPPDGTGARIERATAILREFRGGGHIAVLATHGLLGGCDALLLTELWRGHTDPDGHARFNGWRDGDLAAAWERLEATGRVDADHAITEQGREEREAMETLTSALATQPWDAVPPSDRARTIELLDATASASD